MLVLATCTDSSYAVVHLSRILGGTLSLKWFIDICCAKIFGQYRSMHLVCVYLGGMQAYYPVVGSKRDKSKRDRVYLLSS